MNIIAIVIPAFKKKFFEKTLASLARQTNKCFNIYVGDDNSPEDLREVCEKFNSELDIVYTKFDNNIGAKNLVNQWSRCVKLTKNEEWIWLFSDDDLIDDNCVESFYKKIDEDNKKVDVYRFNTVVINTNDEILWKMPNGPLYESSLEMAYNLLLGQRGNSMSDHIFSRSIYDKCGGFVFTEYAQGADWATSILFSCDKGISVIPNSFFYWRYSGNNISSYKGKNKDQMLNGHIQFIEWVLKHFAYLKGVENEITYDMIRFACKENLQTIIISHYKGISFKNLLPLTFSMFKNLALTYSEIVKLLYLIFSCTNKTFNKLSRFKQNFKAKFV